MRRITPSTEIVASRIRGGVPLVLRHPRWADYDQWAAIRLKDADYLRPWEPEWTDAHLSRGSYRLRLNRFKKMVAGERAYPFHVFRSDTDALIGACNLTHVERGAAHSAKIGYWIGREHSGRGHARASVRALTGFAFDTLGLHRVEAAVQPENEASIRVLLATGYRYEGQARGLLKIDGAWADHAVYARLSTD